MLFEDQDRVLPRAMESRYRNESRRLTEKIRLADLSAADCEFGYIWISSGIGTNLLDVRCWHLASFRCDAEFGRYRV